jgi:hypothetical protein
MRSTIRFSVVLAFAMAVAAGGCGAKAQTPSDTTTAPAVGANPSAAVETQQLTANLRAAIANHDMRMYGVLRKRLADEVGQDVIRSVQEMYRQALANLRAAIARHDGKARASFHVQLRALCAPTSLTSAIEFCEKDLAAAGG